MDANNAQSVFGVISDVIEIQRKPKQPPPPFLLRHTLFLLPILVVTSIIILFLSFTVPRIYRFIKSKIQRHRYQPILLEDEAEVEADDVEPPTPPPPMPSGGLWSDFSAHIRSMKEYGSLLFFLEVLRTLCIAALLGLSVYAAIQAESPTRAPHSAELEDDTVWDMAKHWGKHGKHKKKKKHSKSTVDDYSSLEWGEFATPLRRHLITHVDTLLFLGWCLYAYRDLLPLLTYTLDPADINNAITWSRVAILTVSAVIIPLLRPRTYTPVDPLNPTPEAEIHPEQTASWLSFIFYEFMSPLVWKAWKSPSLPYDELHPLADYDRAEHLYALHMDTLDPIRRKAKGYKDQNLLVSIFYVFRKEIVVICSMAALSSVAELAGSIGINKLLDYLEKDGKGFVIRPIVWVVFLFLGPTIGSLTIQLYIFTTTRCLVRSEALLTQLLFDHALRLRMKDAIEDTKTDQVPEIRIEEVVEAGPGNAEAVIEEGSESATEVGSADGAKDKQAAADEEAKKTKGQGLAGKINVLMAADVESVIEGRDLALVFVYTPIQLALCIVLLYRILSWSAIVGMLTMVVTLPIPGLITKKNAQYQHQRMIATDSRVDSITEAIGALRMIKMFGWEDRVKERIATKREDELHLIWQRRLMSLAVIILNNILPVLTMTVTFAMYTLVQGRQLTAATVFTSMTVFELVKGQMGMCFYLINAFVTGWVSLQRINKFLHSSEMIDEYSEGKLATIKTPEQLEAESEGLIRMKEAVFTWGPIESGNTQDFSLRIPDVTFVKGKINLITGPTGSGKSSLLKESWCMSDSIRDNVLFGEPHEEDRYKQTLRACGLEPDLKLFDDGDETEVGEKGITLSGGQKARLTLARAVYSKTAVVLLDANPQTHHIGLAAPVADFMLALNQDGSIKSLGPIEDGELPDEELEQEAEEENKQAEEVVAAEKAAEEKKPASKLVKDEEKGEGRISKRAMVSFFSTFGGPIFWLLYFIFLLGGQGFNAFQTYWLGRWARAYDQASNPKDVSAIYYLGLYVVWVVISLGSLGASAVLFYVGAVKASREMHRRLVESIFGAYMRFLDATPDMKAIDGSFTETFSQVADITIGLILKFLVVIALVPFFSLPALVIGAVGGFLGEVYIHGQLSVKREMSNAKSPLFSHLSAAVNGIVSIRAYGAQQKLRAEAQRKADKYTRAATAL
ncbi:hypothetical protein IAT40_000501 [Kwoniella sp. CBS 6097]